MWAFCGARQVRKRVSRDDRLYALAAAAGWASAAKTFWHVGTNFNHWRSSGIVPGANP